MIYKDLKTAIELYLTLRGTEISALILQFTNENILTFSRMREWLKIKIAETITLDDSDSYDLSSILRNQFGSEIALIDASGTGMKKYNYENYLQLSSKAGAWSIMGDILYVIGDVTDLTFIYSSPGQILKQHAIYAVDQGNKEFTIDGDVRAYFKAGKKIFVTGSTGNNGTYTVATIALVSDDTVLTVNETIPDATVDGNIRSSFQYPFTGNDYDEVKVVIYYWDIIKQMTINSILDYLGDETIRKEEGNLSRKLDNLIKNERRVNNLGKAQIVTR